MRKGKKMIIILMNHLFFNGLGATSIKKTAKKSVRKYKLFAANFGGT
jgi:hypothetical protein